MHTVIRFHTFLDTQRSRVHLPNPTNITTCRSSSWLQANWGQLDQQLGTCNEFLLYGLMPDFWLPHQDWRRAKEAQLRRCTKGEDDATLVLRDGKFREKSEKHCITMNCETRVLYKSLRTMSAHCHGWYVELFVFGVAWNCIPHFQPVCIW